MICLEIRYKRKSDKFAIVERIEVLYFLITHQLITHHYLSGLVPKQPKGPRCKRGGSAFGGANPSQPTNFRKAKI